MLTNTITKQTLIYWITEFARWGQNRTQIYKRKTYYNWLANSELLNGRITTLSSFIYLFIFYRVVPIIMAHRNSRTLPHVDAWAAPALYSPWWDCVGPGKRWWGRPAAATAGGRPSARPGSPPHAATAAAHPSSPPPPSPLSPGRRLSSLWGVRRGVMCRGLGFRCGLFSSFVFFPLNYYFLHLFSFNLHLGVFFTFFFPLPVLHHFIIVFFPCLL